MSSDVIRTPDQRLRVYVSGDPARLGAERSQARAAVESLHLTPVSVDVEGAAGRNLAASYLEQSNAFVGVYEPGPGEAAPGGERSLQELELEAAGRLPRLLYVRAGDGDPSDLPRYLAAATRDGVPLKRYAAATELRELIRDDLAALLSQRFAASVAHASEAPASGAAPAVTLPVQLTPFVGRVKEVGEVAALLADPSTRLVTLSGPGGIGKSRLAYEVAATVAGDFADGVTAVLLSSVADPHLVIPAIARALDVKESAERTLVENLKELLRTKEMLLLLDNFEHVVGAAHVLSGILESCAGVKLLVTSRAVLFIRGELEYRVPPLALPEGPPPCRVADVAGFEAVRLFAQRAQAADPSFALTDENAPAIAEICARLDGLPLAIELAAARTRLLRPEAILARLAHRLQLLTGGPVDLPERQQTLRATLDWDYDLLDPGEQEVFRKLAVFSGGFTLDAAESVLGTPDAFEFVESLTSKSLLTQGAGGGDARFSMLRTLREYAFEKLAGAGEEDAVRDAHAAFFLRLAEEAAPQLRGRDQVRWLEVLDAEADNMRTALRWAAGSGDLETELRLAAALGEYWEFRAHLSEGQRALEDALARADGAPSELRAPCLECAGVMARGQGEYKRAAAFVDQAIALYRETADEHALSRALKQRGVVASERGDRETARSFYEQSLEIKERLGDRRGIAEAQNNLGVLARLEGHLDSAITYYESALGYFRDAGDRKAIARILMNLGEARMERGELAAAEGFIVESLRLCRAIGSAWDTADLLELMATVQNGFGDAAAAATLFGAGQALRDLLGAPVPEAEVEAYGARLEAVRKRLPGPEFDGAWTRGQTMSTGEAVDYALGLARAGAAG